MRVIHVVPAITNEASGPSYTVVRLCESLIDLGLDAQLAALDWAPIGKKPAFLRTFPLGVVGPRRLGRSPDMARWLAMEVQSRRVSLMHSHGMWQMNAVYPGRVASKYKTPLMLSPRGAWSEWAMASGSLVKRPFWALIQRPSVEAVTCFHATAENEYQDIRRLGFRQPVAIIPNGIDIPFKIEKCSKSVRTLLFLSRIHPKKGLDMLLPAWGAIQARFPDWQLQIVGNDDGYYGVSGYLEELQTLSKQLGLQRIQFLGALHGEAKWKAYADADLFVLPTYSENFGISVAEALAAGIPSIVSKGAPWIGLEKQGAGRWIEIGLEPLVAGLEDLMRRSPEQLQTMGRLGREWMLREFDWRIIGQQMKDVYCWLVGKISCPPSCVKLD